MWMICSASRLPWTWVTVFRLVLPPRLPQKAWPNGWMKCDCPVAASRCLSKIPLLPGECTLTRQSRKIAWSNLGCIAYISHDGLRVNVRYLHCQPRDGKWDLSDETPLPSITEIHRGVPLTHLVWNETGSELAVLDLSGRLSVYTITTALNQITVQRPATFDPDDDGNQVVGVIWLNSNRSVSFLSPDFSLCLSVSLLRAQFLGSRVSSCLQDDRNLDILPLSTASYRSFPSGSQAGLAQRDEVGPYSTGLSKSRQQVV